MSLFVAACASADTHRTTEIHDDKASVRVVVDPTPGELHSLVLSGDGKVVAGTVLGLFGPQAFIWTEAKGRQELPAAPGGRFGRINGISRDGTRVVGVGRLQSRRPPEENALLWQSGKGTTALGHLQRNPEIDQTKGLAISADGAVVAGSSRTPGSKMRPFLWSEATGMRDLDAELRDHSDPVALNGDGTVVTGRLMDLSVGHRAFRWSTGGGVELLGEVRDEARAGNVHSSPMAISRDGRVIVGNHGTAGREGRGAQHAFRWNAEEGIVDLGVLSGGVDHSIANAVNADGTVIVGSSGSNVEAFVWDAVHGMRSLREVLQAWGVDTKGWRFTQAVGVSDDGTRILCYGYGPHTDDVNEVAVLATLPSEAFRKAP